METLILTAFKILTTVVAFILLADVLNFFMTGTLTITVFSFLNDLVNQIQVIPFQIMEFFACVAFQLFDFAISAIWDMVPAVSDAVSAPSVSDLFNAC